MNQEAAAPFRWTKPKRRAAALLALDELKDEEIAEKVGVSPRALWYWKAHPDFKAEIERLCAEAAERIMARGIARKEKRIEAANERHQLMNQVIRSRAKVNRHRNVNGLSDEDEPMDLLGYTAAGADTGLMVHTVTYLKEGRREEWAIDTGLLKELRELEKQAAQEMGQWVTRSETTGKDGDPIRIELSRPDLSALSDEELEILERIARSTSPTD